MPDYQVLSSSLQAQADELWGLAIETGHSDLFLAWTRVRQARSFVERLIPRDKRPDVEATGVVGVDRPG
jgi:hypothetical protein